MTHKEKILNLLQRKGPEGALNTELNEIAFRYSARIAELRKEGYPIVRRHEKGGLWRYQLTTEG